MLSGLLGASSAHAANIVHEFYVPMPEAHERTALVSIEPASGIVGQTLESVISIVVTGAGSVIHYDEWEDGYEVDLNHPAQSTTKIWGDGNNANGVPPGYANDPAGLISGAVINLRNLVSLPRNPATLLYDGRDRFGGTKALVVTRTGWAVNPGTVLAGSVEVTATIDYGTQYVSPVGQDVSASSMFEYVGWMIMARENGTSVTVDVNGPVSGGATTFVLNQGESYLVNGGVLKGATVNATKPVQTQLITGDIGARYETDWFTLYPTDQWTGTYYSPVGTAADGDPAYGFFYNPTASPLTIHVTTCLGTSSFVLPANGTYQYQMPQNCGAQFKSAGEVPYFGIVMVGANPTANNVHDWGFTLVPSDSLTTEAVVGWGPGSGDLTQNGSPVWVTPIDSARVYVDYNGDRLGSLTDPRGNKYDVHYDMGALETRRLFDPDKDQSAMRIYTLDGVQIAAAWGQDPATAGPGNPYLDVGTTVLPFPVPNLIKSFSTVTDTAPAGLSIGDTIEYRIDVNNKGLLPLGNLLVLDPLNVSLTYVAASTKRDGVAIADNGSGTPFPLDESGFVIPIILRGGNTTFTYRCTINAAGSINNTASNSNYNLISTANVVVPPPAGSTACGAQFTNAAGVVQSAYSGGAPVYATLTDPDANNNVGAVEQITVAVTNTSNGDAEFVTLVETGVSSGVFRNATGLATSTTAGASQMDGTLLVSPGNSLSFTYVDPEFNETCTGSATISVPTLNKYLYLSDPSQALDRIDPVATSDGTTASTAALSVPGGAITVDATTAPTGANSVSSFTFSHTVGTGSNRLLLVGVSLGATSSTGDPPAVAGVTYNSTAMVQIASQVSGGGASNDDVITYLYQMKNPPSGPANVVVSLSGSGSVVAGATSFNNVNQTTTFGTAVSSSGTSGTASATVSSAANELVFSVVGWDEAATVTVAGGQTSRWNLSVSSVTTGAASTEPGAASVTSTYTSGTTGQDWAVVAVPIKPFINPGNPTVSFTQAPVFASPFTMPAGSAPTVTAHYTVSSGTMPGNPSITATLKRNTTTIATSTSASAAGGLLTFTFPVFATAANFIAGEYLAIEITTAQSDLAFTIDYDSATKASKITLPTTTVITNTALGVYDAPYPGGSLITAPVSGSTVYVRGTASDPFGHYDITSMGLLIDVPSPGADITATLNAGNVVNTTTASKTFEYAWTVGSTIGTYNLSTTANEGTEGINATRATSVNVTFLDLGTPSVTEFTTGFDGPGTPIYAGNEQVCVRIVDLDQNLNAAAIETIQATITSAIGDSEFVTLTETGVNTGVFAFCIPASTSAPNIHDNGTLHAVLGDVLTVNYVDPTDSTDTGRDTATIPNIAPAISVNKTLVTPADGFAVVGEALQYTVQVTNTGNTTLSNVSLVDTFPTADLTFVSASVAPNSTAPAGTLTWNNVGPLVQGQSVTLTLNFTALTTAAPAVNTATANAGGGVTSADTANVTITDPRITISKTLFSPNPGPANIGDSVVFRIAVQNTGDTAIATLPIEDVYSGADFEFVSATIAPDASGSGSLLWLDVTGAGNLAVGDSISIDVTLRAKGAAVPASNLAKAEFTVDVNGDSAPPVSSSASITLIAASITGYVYNDAGTNGAYNPPSDTPLGDVTVSLYTDPNGDGNPADGVLVKIATTDVNGLYEFLNLPTGNYVVVESQPPGYSSHSDTAGANDNRIPVVISTLTAHAGNNFFDFLTPPLSYASIEGAVWNDADASGTLNGGETGLENVAVSLIEDTNGNGVADPGEPLVQATLTASDGSYSFGALNPGSYVVVETDLFGWTSTADVASPNNNQIPVVLTAGQNVTGRDFLDVLMGTTGGKVFHDVNGNGSFDAGDVALANIDVIVTDSLGGVQTVSTDLNGNWTATVPPGSTNIDVLQTDPQFTAVFTTGYSQTAGTDPSNFIAVSGVNTPAGDDGFRRNAVVGNLVWHDANNDGLFNNGETGIDGVSVELLDSSNFSFGTTLTAGGGLYSFSNVPPGSYRLRIATPPALYPLSSTTTDTADNAEDGDDNGTQATPTAATLSPLFAVTAGEVDNTLDFGFTAISGTRSISGQVRDDFDVDGNFSDSDKPVPNVTVRLYADSNGNGSYDAGIDTQVATTTTDSFGSYSFTGLPDGAYFVQEIDPVASSSTADTQGNNDNIIPVTLAGSDSSGNDFLDAVDPSGYAYDVVTGQIIGGGSISVSGPGVVTILLDGSTGQYSFLTDGTLGSYTLTYTPPLGYIIDPARPVEGPFIDPTGGPNPYVLGSNENPSNPGYLTNSTAVGNPYYLTFVLTSGDPFIIQNNIPLRQQTPRRYGYWKNVTPGGGPNPGSNGDGDCHTDLVEYALNLNPNSGVQTTPAFRGVRNTLTGKLDVSFNRVAGSVQDVAYTLVGIRSLTDSPAGWTALSIVPGITNNLDGTETVTFADVESDPYFTGYTQGAVRLKLDLDENLDTVIDTTANTPAFGWTRRTFVADCVMTGHPYLKNKVFCGTIDAVVGNALNVTTSTGGISVAAQFVTGRQYFVEICAGDHAGHRFEIDEAASTASSIVLEASGTLNTLSIIPATLSGDKAVVQEHHTLNELFPSTQFTPGPNATLADRVMFYDGGTGGFKIYWLYANGGSPKWVVSGNATLDDEGGRVIGPAEGWFTHPKGASVPVVWHGMVRANPFACPLAAGPNFIGSGYPMDQSPVMRGMTVANGFRGNRNPTLADELLFWKGFTSTQAPAYFNHFLLSHGALQHWTELSNASLLNENNLLMFKATSGSIYKMRAPLPAYVMPLPWTP